jgi:hypothetical protein
MARTAIDEYLRRAVEALEMADDCGDARIRFSCATLSEEWLRRADEELTRERDEASRQ